jgi:hypothetical protein
MIESYVGQFILLDIRPEIAGHFSFVEKGWNTPFQSLGHVFIMTEKYGA